MRRLALLAIALALPASGQVVSATSRGVVVAYEHRVRLAGAWDVDGVQNATAIVTGNDRIAVLDALNNEAVIVELASGSASRVTTAETPIAGVFVGRDLYVLARDARMLQRIGGRSIPVAADPAFVRESNGSLYVYSRATGAIEEVRGDAVVRTANAGPFASDFEIGGRIGYLTYPHESRVRVVSLDEMKTSGEVSVGAVPVDLAFAGGGTALTARILAVADPSSKRVWLTESTQSTATAVARGFLRGLIGLGLFGGRASQFATGVDRVMLRDKVWVAYDTSSGTLYRFAKSKSSVIAKGVPPQAFAITTDGVAYWLNGRLQLAR